MSQRCSFPWISILNLLEGTSAGGCWRQKALPTQRSFAEAPLFFLGSQWGVCPAGVSLLEITGPRGYTGLWKALGARGSNKPGWYFPQSPGHQSSLLCRGISASPPLLFPRNPRYRGMDDKADFSLLISKQNQTLLSLECQVCCLLQCPLNQASVFSSSF